MDKTKDLDKAPNDERQDAIRKATLILGIHNRSPQINIRIVPIPDDLENIVVSTTCPCNAELNELGYKELVKGYECKCGLFIYRLDIHKDHYHIVREKRKSSTGDCYQE